MGFCGRAYDAGRRIRLALVLACALAVFGSPGQPASAAGPEATASVTGIGVQGDARRTRVSVHLDRAVRFAIYTLADPFRIVVDLDAARFEDGARAGLVARGLIEASRCGTAGGNGRIVLATRGPVAVDAAHVFRVPGEKGARLDVDLIETSASGYKVVAPAGSAALLDGTGAPPARTGAAPKVRPVVVIDPGHGGADPGALNGDVAEKTVVLAVARLAKAEIEAAGEIEVVLTRAEDESLSLARRVEMSRASQARLFVSIHADSLAGSPFAQSVRGATIYTLSEKASSEEARLLAEKENAADTLVGREARVDDDDPQIRGILADLVRRETARASLDLRNRLLPHLRASIGLSKDPARAAGFRVLRQAEVPAVLVELGYMSNRQDAQMLVSPDWQRKIAAAIAAAVADYFKAQPGAAASVHRRASSR
ncbi:MAG: N-acetylmuramoyl-L-alanine amidase [Hyphomicrobiales bacterium]|nr:MAG: N-acetylmuramoyl-L-alanine amidase [Hyphomicrobiales bacterium]